ncbi:MAG TPA: DUF4760 domain-containing protein [Allosphingosinicella sp.]|jgi:hypothetical protein
MDEGISVIIAAVLAILGIFYASRQQRKMLRKQHTYQVLEKLNDWSDFEKNLDFASSLIRAGKVPRLCGESDKDSCDKIDFLLNYYEFLASAIIAGDIDEGLVRRVEQSRLCRLYLKFLPYIEENREDRESSSMWENLEFMCHRWTLGRSDPFEAALTLFLLRPSAAHFHNDRDAIAIALREHSSRMK